MDPSIRAISKNFSASLGSDGIAVFGPFEPGVIVEDAVFCMHVQTAATGLNIVVDIRALNKPLSTETTNPTTLGAEIIASGRSLAGIAHGSTVGCPTLPLSNTDEANVIELPIGWVASQTERYLAFRVGAVVPIVDFASIWLRLRFPDPSPKLAEAP